MKLKMSSPSGHPQSMTDSRGLFRSLSSASSAARNHFMPAFLPTRLREDPFSHSVTQKLHGLDYPALDRSSDYIESLPVISYTGQASGHTGTPPISTAPFSLRRTVWYSESPN